MTLDVMALVRKETHMTAQFSFHAEGTVDDGHVLGTNGTWVGVG